MLSSNQWDRPWNQEMVRKLDGQTKRLPSPSTLNMDVFLKTIDDMIMEEQKKIVDQYTRDMLCSIPKYTITEEEFNKIHPWFIKTNNEKEKEKMNAKRCDRCGKLYIPINDDPLRAYLCGRVTAHEKETYTPEKIKEFNTFNMRVVITGVDTIDMCPECCDKLKNFFESGADEVKEN